MIRLLRAARPRMVLAAPALLALIGCAGPQAADDPPVPINSFVAESSPAPAPPDTQASWGLVIHGGAGTISRDAMTPEREAEYNAALTAALEAGHAVLAGGGSSLDAVVAAINTMEDSPLFNAGKGAVFTHEGKNELDAAIMYGPTREAGAIAGVTRVKNPINLARLVMESSPHVFMAGAGAEAFAQEHRVELVPENYFYTEERWQSLQRALEEEKQRPTSLHESDGSSEIPGTDDRKFGTVGAVALDKDGNLAAGTSTGGMTNKRFGRIGDVPVIGAGTYADERCAVSATGHGEFFIRYTVAHDICARVEYLDMDLGAAAEAVVLHELVAVQGEGGVIAMDNEGNMAMPFNSSGMYRGRIGPDGRGEVAIFK